MFIVATNRLLSTYLMEQETQRQLRPRPPNRGKKRQIVHSSPESSGPTADVIRIRTPAIAKPAKRVTQREHPQKELQTPFLPATLNFSFSPPQLPEQLHGNQEGPEYLQTVNRALHLITHASQLHATLYTNPTREQIAEQRLIAQAQISLERVIKGQISEDLEGGVTPSSEDAAENSTRCFVDRSTTTTNEHISLDDRIQSLESKLHRLLNKPSYASALQNQVPVTYPTQKAVNCDSVPATRPISLENTRFVIELENPVLENFDPLPLREKLNRLLPDHCARLTTIQRSQKGNLVCYTLGDPSTTIESFEVWSPGIPFGAIRINAEERWARRILYLENTCPSATLLEEELKQCNPHLRLMMTPRLLTPTVALLLFSSEEEAPEHLFAFATYRRLASYRTRTPAEIQHARARKKEKERGYRNGGEEQEIEEPETAVVEVVEEVEGTEAMEMEEMEADRATQMEELERERKAEAPYWRAKMLRRINGD